MRRLTPEKPRRASTKTTTTKTTATKRARTPMRTKKPDLIKLHIGGKVQVDNILYDVKHDANGLYVSRSDGRYYLEDFGHRHPDSNALTPVGVARKGAIRYA